MEEIKQGYKQTDIGVIPEDWDIRPIGEVLKVTTGNKNTQDKKDDGIYPFFVRSQTVERINTYTFDGEGVLTAGDGVGTGKVFHYINGKFDYHQRVYLMHGFEDKVLGKYFFLFFSKYFYERINQLTAKSSVDSVRREMIADMLLPLPKKDEQTAIATALSDTDALIVTLDKKIAKKQQIKQGAMQQLLTGKKRLPGFSGEWVEKALGECFTKIVGGGTPSRANPDYWNGNIPWATVKDFASFNVNATQEYITNVGLMNSSSHLIPKDTPITSTRMGLGKIMVYNVDVAINQDLKALFIKDDYDQNYIVHWFTFSSEIIEALGTGSTVKGIRLEQLRNINIFLPVDKYEQTAIAQILTDMDNDIAQLEKERDKYKELKAGMMQVLLTGKVRLV